VTVLWGKKKKKKETKKQSAAMKQYAFGARGALIRRCRLREGARNQAFFANIVI